MQRRGTGGAETLDVVLKLWAADGKFTYHGTYFNIDAPDLDTVTGRGLYMKPYQQPHPPIGVASTTVDSGSLRLAGARGWIPMSSSLLAPPYQDTLANGARGGSRRWARR
jgi:alkanesulfonate monooxygenase SsuD/methylene tetrahydromethanopterin reductase-like flavin-dependent oxidoreductase (luciferase family)